MALAYGADAPMWVANTPSAQRQQLNTLISVEQDAVEITDVNPLLMPGLLQTEDYIHVRMSSGGYLSPTEIAIRTKIRLDRQRVITRERPVRFTAFMASGLNGSVTPSPCSEVLSCLLWLLWRVRRPALDARAPRMPRFGRA